jgi:hypothetical protein
VDPPATEGGFWHFVGTPGVADLTDDGRRVLFGRGSDVPGPYASATEAMSHMELSDAERLAVAAALGALQRREACDRATLREAAASVRAEGAISDSDWLDGRLFDLLDRLPGVHHTDDEWRYTLTPDGYEPSA